MTVYRNSRNENVSLSDEVGGRGEGKVYTVSGNFGYVAKIWNLPNSEAAAKIEIMIRNRPPVPDGGGSLFVKPHIPFAWPEDALYGPDGKIAGYLMPRIDLSSFRDIFRYYVPKERQELEQTRGAEYRRQDFLLMARNLAEAVGYVHQAGYVIGDINETNMLASDKADVVIIDCDSMQVQNPVTDETYLCVVGRPDYTPPGLTPGAERTTNDDCFGLAVLVFKLLMQGEHPYKISSTKTETRDKIRLGEFPYRDNKRRITDAMRRYRENWQSMEPNLRRYFRDAFAPDYKSSRPSAGELVEELNRVIDPSSTGISVTASPRLQEANRQLEYERQERSKRELGLLAEQKARSEADNELAYAYQRITNAERQLETERRQRANVERKLKDTDNKRADAERQLEREQVARHEAGKRLQEVEEQLKAEREELINTKQQLENEKQIRENSDQQLAAERRARNQASQPRNSQRIEKAAKVTLIVASYVTPPVITALLFALFY